MTDLRSYFPRIWETPEGWKADCPACGDKEHKFHWNTTKQVGCCMHSRCIWFYLRGGATLRRVIGYMTSKYLRLNVPEVISMAPEADISLPKEYKPIGECEMRSTLYAYMESRGIPRRVVDGAHVGYCANGRWWGYLIFPVFNDEGEVVYWQARRFKNREPKFYNPKSSKKSELVYRIGHSIRPKRIILVESIFNALTLENLGKTSTLVMALLGKTMSQTQMDYIFRFERNLLEIVVALDGDARGKAVAIAEQFWNLNRAKLAVKVAAIPDGKDINSLGREKSMRCIEMAEVFDKSRRLEMAARVVA